MVKWIAPLLASILLINAAFAGHAVSGYTRKDGTYVAPHFSRDKGEGLSSGSISFPTYGGVQRDSNGKILRSESEKDAFKRNHPCPSTGAATGACPGYVVDHVQALKHGGADDPGNMQWQTKSDAKAKDKWE
jgi:hypothetical protein